MKTQKLLTTGEWGQVNDWNYFINIPANLSYLGNSIEFDASRNQISTALLAHNWNGAYYAAQFSGNVNISGGNFDVNQDTIIV